MDKQCKYIQLNNLSENKPSSISAYERIANGFRLGREFDAADVFGIDDADKYVDSIYDAGRKMHQVLQNKFGIQRHIVSNSEHSLVYEFILPK